MIHARVDGHAVTNITTPVSMGRKLLYVRPSMIKVMLRGPLLQL